jgi:hypothetical protein
MNRKLTVELPGDKQEDNLKEEEEAPMWYPKGGKNAPSPR